MNFLLASRIARNKIRFGVRKLFFNSGELRFRGMILISGKCRLEIAKGALLAIDHKDRIEEGGLVAVRENASIVLGENVFINRNCTIVAHSKITIGRGVQIGPNVCIYDHDHDTKNRGEVISSPVNIGDNVWIGAGCLILKGFSIGSNATIGAGCVVTRNVPENCTMIQKGKLLSDR